MGKNTGIEWTESTWTPIRARSKATREVGWHCEHVTPGCENCYAETFNRRLGTGLLFKPGHRNDVELFLDDKMLLEPLRWRKPRRIFVCSMTDLFADFVPDDWIGRVFAVMALAPQHTFQVLTKRSKRMREYCAQGDARRADALGSAVFALGYQGELESLRWPLPNVWLGVSCEDQTRADERIPDLLATPAPVRFVSAEPLLGPINLADAMTTDAGLAALFANLESGDGRDGRGSLHWIIVGGESGASARPMPPQWARDIRDQCAAAGVAFFHKQNGEFLPATNPFDGLPRDKTTGQPMVRVGTFRAGRLLDGVEHNAFPKSADERQSQ